MGTRGNHLRKKPGKKKKRKTPQQTLSLDNLPPVLLAKYGSFAAVGRHFGVTRQAVEDYVARYPDILRPVVKQAKESMIDKAIDGLGYHLDKKALRAIFFTLETIGKKRGFIRQMELAGADPTTGALPIQIVMESNGREVIQPTPVSHDANLGSEETEGNEPEEPANRADGSEQSIPPD